MLKNFPLFPTSFIVLSPTFKTLIHLALALYMVRDKEDENLASVFNIQFFQHLLLRIWYFLQCMFFFVALSEISCWSVCGFISVLLIFVSVFVFDCSFIYFEVRDSDVSSFLLRIGLAFQSYL